MDARVTKAESAPTQAELVSIGVSQSYASELLAGKKTPSLKLAVRIFQRLGFPVTAWPLRS